MVAYHYQLKKDFLAQFCFNMKIQAVEDEIHFLLRCPCYIKQRKRFSGKLTQIHYGLHLLEDSDKGGGK